MSNRTVNFAGHVTKVPKWHIAKMGKLSISDFHSSSFHQSSTIIAEANADSNMKKQQHKLLNIALTAYFSQRSGTSW